MTDPYYTTVGGMHKLNENGQLLWSITGKGVDRLFKIETTLSKIVGFAKHTSGCKLLPDANCTCGLYAIRRAAHNLLSNTPPPPTVDGEKP